MPKSLEYQKGYFDGFEAALRTTESQESKAVEYARFVKHEIIHAIDAPPTCSGSTPA